MKEYGQKWKGLDRGHEGLWSPQVWFAVLKSVKAHSQFQYLDPHSPVYSDLKQLAPSQAWVSVELDGSRRTMFRDAREPWASTGVLEFDDSKAIATVSEVGNEVLAGSVTYADVLVSSMSRHEEEGTHPFAVLADVFLQVGSFRGLSTDNLLSVMVHYRAGDNLEEALAAQTNLGGKVEERRMRMMLLLMSYTGGIRVSQKQYFMASEKVLKQIAGIENCMKNTTKKIDVSFPRPDILAAIRTKPFILFAGISGTGKSRMVRQLARGCCPVGSPLWDEQKPGNFEMIQVRPNWHDSTELLGYVSRISGKSEYQLTPFVRFLAMAWLNPTVPFFLCLDEMNLAPVEQYFAEYLSVVETRKRDEAAGEIRTDPLVVLPVEIAKVTLDRLFDGVDHGEAQPLIDRFRKAKGIPIPPNLVVMGTVNMDETTFSFSRKVLDRAMSFELSEVDMKGGLDADMDTPQGSIPVAAATPAFVQPPEFYAANKAVCDEAIGFLEAVNAVLEPTPFKVAYRTRDEVLLYCVERLKGGASLPQALDEATSMKVLSRVEGDQNRKGLLEALNKTIREQLTNRGDAAGDCKVCSKKIDEMLAQLENGAYTSFWTR